MNGLASPAPAMRRVLADWAILLGLVALIPAFGRVALPRVRVIAGAPVLVIAPPWGPGAAAMVAEAGGRNLGPVDAMFGTLATFDGMVPVDELRALGAWSVRDGAALASICGVILK